MKKLAIITTHPIQYNAPWFKLLNSNGKVHPKVFYTWGQLQSNSKFDPGFGKAIEWDIPLLDGYQYTFVKNTSFDPGSHHRRGIINPSLIKEIEQWQPDALLIFGWNFISHLNCIKFFHKKIPILFRGDSTLLRKQSFLKSTLRKIYLKYIYSYIDIAFYVGSENKKYFLKYGLKINQLISAPHAVDNARFADINNKYQIEADNWKKDLKIPDNSLVIVYAGKLESIKNPSIIIEFAMSLRNKAVYFIIVGNGKLENELKEKCYGNNQIIFIDFQNQQKMPIVYRLGHFFMLSSDSETWGLSINEAMACSRSLIIRDTCGCSIDLVKDGENGFLFQKDNISRLTAKFTELIDAKENTCWSKMGEESLKIIDSYNFTNIVLAIESFFESENK